MAPSKNATIGLKTLFFLILFSILGYADASGQLRVLPLGNSITKGIWCTTGNINNCQPVADDLAVGYRKRLYELLDDAGYNPDFGGTYKAGYDLMTDPDHAGFAGIMDDQLADVMESGNTSSPFGQITPGPYLSYLNTTGFNPEVILLHIGSNDVLAGSYSNVDGVERILNAIDDYETAYGKQVLVFVAKIISRKEKPCGTDAEIQQFNNRLATLVYGRISSGDNLVLVDMECSAGLSYYSDMGDIVHPAQSGYDKMADLWFQHIDNYNTAPNVSNIPDQTVDRGVAFSQISLDNYVSDAEDLPEDMTWTTIPETPAHFSVSIDENRVATILPLEDQWSGSENIEFVATDKGKLIEGLKKSGSTLTTFTVNWFPEISGQQEIRIPEGGSHTITLDDLVLVQPELAPVGTRVVAYAGDNYSLSNTTVTADQSFNGLLSVPVKVVAGADESELYNLIIDVSSTNYPPMILSVPLTSIQSGHEYHYQMVVSDLDPEDVMSYSALQKPSWMQVDPVTGLVSGIPSRADVGVSPVLLQVSDGLEEDQQSYNVEVSYYNFPPEIESEPKDTAIVAESYIYAISAVDNDNDALFYFSHDIPEWLQFSESSRVLIGSPKIQDLGPNLVVLGVTDLIDTTFQAYNVEVVGVVNVMDRDHSGAIRVYPNPAKEYVLVDISGLDEVAGELRIFVTDLTGRQIFEASLDDEITRVELPLPSTSTGFYLYHITDTRQQIVYKSGRLVLSQQGN